MHIGSRWVHLAVKDDELARSAIAFFKEAIAACPFKITHVLTDGGSCFTADRFDAACRKLKVEHRRTKPYTPQTNGLVERFNGRVQREVDDAGGHCGGAQALASQQSRTIRARQTTFWGVLRSRTKLSKRSRSAAGISMRSILPIGAASHVGPDFGITRQ
ncbi:hypothetical protein AA309_28610 [Microvirga vignae]|uniref:Integrase catalytic domain-containing protein n=1 Tax=Microvirga vignae TaxID=1225564 RepID=A0A0H1RBH0_9HYPH|nr:hypothetical protein AA309_28610 [Microvirga vignae]